MRELEISPEPDDPAVAAAIARALERLEREEGLTAGAPHEPQNRLPGASSPPHCEQVSVRRLPQSSQKRRPSRFSAWHREHLMPWLHRVTRGMLGDTKTDAKG